MSDDVQVTIGAKIDGLLAGVEQAKASIVSLASPVNNIISTFKGVTEALATAFGVHALIHFAENMAEIGLQSERTAAMLGITTSAVGELSGIAKLTGTDMGGLALSLERMSLNVQRSTKDAFSPQAQALKVLGLNARELIGLPADQYFDKLRGSVSQLSPSLNLTNALMAVGGRGIAQMIPMLQLSAEEWAHLKERLDAAKGSVPGFVTAAAQTHENLSLLSISTTSLGKSLFMALKPAIDGTVKALSDLFQWMRDSAQAGGALEPVWTALAFAAKGVATAVASIVLVVQALGLAVAWLLKAAVADADQLQDYMADSAEEFAKIGNAYKETLKSIWLPSITVTKNAAKENAAALNELAKQQLQIATSAAEAIIAARLQVFEREKIAITLARDLYRTTENQKAAATMDAAERSYQAHRASLEKIRDSWKADPVEYAKRNKEIEALDSTHQTEIVRMNADSVRAQQTQWDNLGGAIMTSFNSNLRGLLAGTTSWLQTFKSLMADMAIFFIQEVEKMVVKWTMGQLAQLTATQAKEGTEVATKVASEGAKTAATTAGVSARTGAEGVGFATQLGMYISDAFAFIGAQIAKVFAAVTAFLAPVFGPAAPAAALAIAGGVGAAAYGMIHGFDVGTDRVLKGGLAMIHEGEQIVPAEGNGPYTGGAGGGGSGGGGGPIVQIMAWDGASVANWLKRGGAELLLKHLSPAMDANPSLRPSF